MSLLLQLYIVNPGESLFASAVFIVVAVVLGVVAAAIVVGHGSGIDVAYNTV